MIENVKSKYISGDVLCIVPAMNEATVIEVTISELVGLGYHVLCRERWRIRGSTLSQSWPRGIVANGV